MLQWEVSNRALEVLQNTKDAKGRTIEVCKIRLPPPLFRTYKEAEGLEVTHSLLCRRPLQCHFALMCSRSLGPLMQSLCRKVPALSQRLY